MNPSLIVIVVVVVEVVVYITVKRVIKRLRLPSRSSFSLSSSASGVNIMTLP